MAAKWIRKQIQDIPKSSSKHSFFENPASTLINTAPPVINRRVSTRYDLNQCEEAVATGNNSRLSQQQDNDINPTLPYHSTRHNFPKFIILHYSPFKAVWDWVILLLVLYTAVFIPYSIAFLVNDDKARIKNNKDASTRRKSNRYTQANSLLYLDMVVDFMFMFDILISFRTTFVHLGEVVSDPQKIARSYIKGWFLLDTISAIPFDLVLFGADSSNGNFDTLTLTGVLKTARMLRLLRVAKQIHQFTEYGAAVLLLLMATFTLVAHWLACIFHAIAFRHDGKYEETGWLGSLNDLQLRIADNHTKTIAEEPDINSKYITALYFIFTTLTSIGFGNVAPNTNGEKIFTIFAMLIGSLMSAAIFGNVSSIMLRVYQGTEEFHEKTTSIKEFIKFHRIPKNLAHRLEDSFQSNWSYTNGIDMNSVLKNFPECLQADICLHMNRNLLSNCPAFKKASPGCLRTFSMMFRTTHVPPGDTLIHPGDIIDAVYFIARGSIEIHQNNTVMAILGKGDIFGDNPYDDGLGLNQSSYTIRALSYVDMNKIRLIDLREVLAMYPEFAENFLNEFILTFNITKENYQATGTGSNLEDETLKFITLKKPKLQTAPDSKQNSNNGGGHHIRSALKKRSIECRDVTIKNKHAEEPKGAYFQLQNDSTYQELQQPVDTTISLQDNQHIAAIAYHSLQSQSLQGVNDFITSTHTPEALSTHKRNNSMSVLATSNSTLRPYYNRQSIDNSNVIRDEVIHKTDIELKTKDNKHVSRKHKSSSEQDYANMQNSSYNKFPRSLHLAMSKLESLNQRTVRLEDRLNYIVESIFNIVKQDYDLQLNSDNHDTT